MVSWKEFLSGDLASLVQKGIVALIVALPRNLSAIGGEDQEVRKQHFSRFLPSNSRFVGFYAHRTSIVENGASDSGVFC